MKIAIVTPTLEYGGGEKQVEYLARGMRLLGHDVIVFCLSGEGQIADILRRNDIKVIPLYTKLFLGLASKNDPSSANKSDNVFRRGNTKWNRIGRGLNELAAAVKLFFILLVSRPSVVHAYQNQTKMAIVAARAAGIERVVYTETSSIGDWLTRRQLFIMRFFWKLSDAIIVLSATMRRHMVELKASRSDKIHIAHTMLPLPAGARSTKQPENDGAIIVGMVARLAHGKGHTFLLKAAHIIKKTGKNIRFIIAGDGHLKNELKKTAADHGLDGMVEFVGHFKDISDIMDRIDMLVLPSLTEGLPLAVVEGMAYGKPIIATDVGGVSEVVIDGKTGFIVSPRNPVSLANAILELAADPAKRKTFGEEAMERFKSDYSAEKILPIIESIYYRENQKQGHESCIRY